MEQTSSVNSMPRQTSELPPLRELGGGILDFKEALQVLSPLVKTQATFYSELDREEFSLITILRRCERFDGGESLARTLNKYADVDSLPALLILARLHQNSLGKKFPALVDEAKALHYFLRFEDVSRINSFNMLMDRGEYAEALSQILVSTSDRSEKAIRVLEARCADECQQQNAKTFGECIKQSVLYDPVTVFSLVERYFGGLDENFYHSTLSAILHSMDHNLFTEGVPGGFDLYHLDSLWQGRLNDDNLRAAIENIAAGESCGATAAQYFLKEKGVSSRNLTPVQNLCRSCLNPHSLSLELVSRDNAAKFLRLHFS